MSGQTTEKSTPRRLAYALGLTVILLLLALGAGFLYLRQGLPQTRGEISISGLEGPVEIVRDAGGVPHIFAAAITMPGLPRVTFTPRTGCGSWSFSAG